MHQSIATLMVMCASHPLFTEDGNFINSFYASVSPPCNIKNYGYTHH